MSEGNGIDLVTIKELKNVQAKHSARIGKLEGQDVAKQQAIERLRSAFPMGDVEGHRLYHEKQMARIKERHDLWIAVQHHTFPIAICMVLAFTFWALADKVKAWVGSVPPPGAGH
jgi:hypothetical protein